MRDASSEALEEETAVVELWARLRTVKLNISQQCRNIDPPGQIVFSKESYAKNFEVTFF